MKHLSLAFIFSAFVLFPLSCVKDPVDETEEIAFADTLVLNTITLETSDSVYVFSDDLAWNVYIYNANQDQLSFVIQNDDGLSCEIDILGAELSTRTYPFTISYRSDRAYGDIELINTNIPVDCLFGENDSVNYVGQTINWETVFTIHQFKGGVIAGEITGPLYTKTGKALLLKKAYFMSDIIIRE